MSTHTITLIGYCVIAAIGVMLEIFAHRPGSSVPRLDTLVRWVLRTRSGRIGIFAAWAWMGLHFLG
jgi:Family of unknown function (DUF6186)